MKKAPPGAMHIMNPKPLTAPQDALIGETAKLMWSKKSSVVALTDEDRKPIGILSQQGLMLALLDVVNHSMPAGPVTDCLDPSSPPITGQTTLLQMAERFVRRGYAVRALTDSRTSPEPVRAG